MRRSKEKEKIKKDEQEELEAVTMEATNGGTKWGGRSIRWGGWEEKEERRIGWKIRKRDGREEEEEQKTKSWYLLPNNY